MHIVAWALGQVSLDDIAKVIATINAALGVVRFVREAVADRKSKPDRPDRAQ